jgi:hypothetical protein
MASSECQRFEAAVAAGDAIDADLSQHAAGCPHCRALAEITALRLAPAPTNGEDPLRAAVQETAARAAARHRARWERQRRTVPLLIGLAGYLVAAAAVLAVCLPIHLSLPLPPLPLAAPQVALPPPSATQIVAAFAASALWIAAVAVHWLRTTPRRA